MAEIRERLESAVHTLAHIGVTPGEFQEIARGYAAGAVTDRAVSIRSAARKRLEERNIVPDGYIDENEIQIEVIEPPMPPAILGALAVLGTSEARLVLLESLIH